MKLRTLFLAATLALAALSTTACTTTGGGLASNPILLRGAASVATSGLLSRAVKPERRPAVADQLYSVAGAVRSLSGGTVPTAEQFAAAIRQWTPPTDPFFAQLAQTLGIVYAAYYPDLRASGPGKALPYLEALAAGVEDAAALYRVSSRGVANAPASPPRPIADVMHPWCRDPQALGRAALLSARAG